MKRVGKLWIRVFPDLPVSQKPAEVRQGKGKGTPGVVGLPGSSPAGSCSSWTACRARWPSEAFILASAKLPIQHQASSPAWARRAEAMKAGDLKTKTPTS